MPLPEYYAMIDREHGDMCPVTSAEICDIARQLDERAQQYADSTCEPMWQHPGETSESLTHSAAVMRHCADLLRREAHNS